MFVMLALVTLTTAPADEADARTNALAANVIVERTIVWKGMRTPRGVKFSSTEDLE